MTQGLFFRAETHRLNVIPPGIFPHTGLLNKNHLHQHEHCSINDSLQNDIRGDYPIPPASEASQYLFFS